MTATTLILYFFIGYLLTTALRSVATNGIPRMVKAKAAAPAIEAPEPLACEALVTRAFEQRMVDAGIMSVADMATCDDDQCRDCSPTRVAIHAIDRAKYKENRAKSIAEARAAQWLATSEVQEKRKTREANAYALSLREQEIRNKQSQSGRRTSVIEDRIVPLPPNVPKRAVGERHVDSHGVQFIVWTWAEDSRKMALRHPITYQRWESFEKTEPRHVTKSVHFNATCRLCATPYYVPKAVINFYFVCLPCESSRKALPPYVGPVHRAIEAPRIGFERTYK